MGCCMPKPAGKEDSRRGGNARASAAGTTGSGTSSRRPEASKAPRTPIDPTDAGPSTPRPLLINRLPSSSPQSSGKWSSKPRPLLVSRLGSSSAQNLNQVKSNVTRGFGTSGQQTSGPAIASADLPPVYKTSSGPNLGATSFTKRKGHSGHSANSTISGEHFRLTFLDGHGGGDILGGVGGGGGGSNGRTD